MDPTRTELRLMTPAYAAPEQIRGEQVGIFTDVYALGVILYELLAARLPFDLSSRTPAEAERILLSAGTRASLGSRPGACPRRPGPTSMSSVLPPSTKTPSAATDPSKRSFATSITI